jgi:excisionase family DNA binding protein
MNKPQRTQIALEPALTPAEVGAMLNLSLRQVYEAAARGDLPAFRVGKFWRFSPSGIAKILEAADSSVARATRNHQAKASAGNTSPHR